MNYLFSFKINFWIRKGGQVGFGTYFGGNKLDFLHISEDLKMLCI
jgi:hypothetical protein